MCERIEADHASDIEVWKGKKGFYCLIPEENNTIIQQTNDEYTDHANGEIFRPKASPASHKKRREICWQRDVGVSVRSAKARSVNAVTR